MLLTYRQHMKLGPAVIGIIIAGALGYLLEPSLRSALLSSPKKSVVKEPEKAAGGQPTAPPSQSIQPAETAVPGAPAAPAWVAALTPEQLPEKVKLKSRAVLTIPGSAEPMTLPAGVEVTPKRVEGNDLVITPFGGPIEGKIAVMSTDLVERLGNKPPTAPVVAVVEPTTPDPATPTQPATPEPAASEQLSPEEIVAVMQASVKAGEIKEFSFDQVLGWKASDDKESGGETYQTGLASYKAETIFGVKNIQAQALITDGKVAQWVWPKSGLEIK